MTRRTILVMLLWLSVAAATWAEPRTPYGWRKLGSDPLSYEVGVDQHAAFLNHHPAFLRSISPVPTGYVTLAQACLAESYKGRKVTFSAYVKAQDVAGWAGLLIRVDDASGQVLSFQNMQDHPIRGSSNFSRYTVTVDVPHRADRLYFGLLLQGTGEVWMSSLQLTVVGTAAEPPVALPDGVNPSPVNMDFSK